KYSYTAIERLVLPPDTNIFNALYGGRLVEWIDNVASIVSFKHSRRRTVTGSMDSIFFLSQIRMGDIVTMNGRVNYVGKTTMEIEVDVFSEESLTGEKRFATKAYLTYVAIDQNGKSTTVPGLKLENDDDKRRFAEGLERSKARNERLKLVREEAKLFDFV
ncbi:thioesterase superfamily protein, partial [mine drainage metagenome]